MFENGDNLLKQDSELHYHSKHERSGKLKIRMTANFGRKIRF